MVGLVRELEDQAEQIAEETAIYNRGWNDALQNLIEQEKDRVVPDQNRIRDFVALKKKSTQTLR